MDPQGKRRASAGVANTLDPEATFVLVPEDDAERTADGLSVDTATVPGDERQRLRLRLRPLHAYDTTVVGGPPAPQETPRQTRRRSDAPCLLLVPPELEGQFLPTTPDAAATVPMLTEIHPPTPTDSFVATEGETNFYWSSVRQRTTGERYGLQRVLDTGGMGAILEVLDLDLKRKMVMKVVLPSLRNQVDTLDSFVREARATGFLEHPHIIPIHEIGLTREAGLFFTMKLAEGESLKDVLWQVACERPDYVDTYSTFALLGIFRKICDAVGYAHANHLLHLDIKPHNVMVGRHGEVFLTDWGLAQVCGDPQEEPDPVKRAFLSEARKSARECGRHVGGSPAFMSPEQAWGDFAALDQRTDIFLLGATLYHMFTLTPPYIGESLAGVLDLARRCELEAPSLRSPAQQIPEEICRIILRAMAREKRDRYESVGDLIADVDEVMAGRWRPDKRKEFAPGELLMRQGEPGDEAYVILSGRVTVYTEREGQRVLLRECKAGEIIGEMALISNEPRSASVEALEATTVAVITGARFAQHLEGLPPYIGKMVGILADRLRESSAMVHPLLAGDCTPAVLKQARLLTSAAGTLPEGVALEGLAHDVARDLGLPFQRVRDVLATRAGSRGDP